MCARANAPHTYKNGPHVSAWKYANGQTHAHARTQAAARERIHTCKWGCMGASAANRAALVLAGHYGRH